jgi:subtilisin family serine protease
MGGTRQKAIQFGLIVMYSALFGATDRAAAALLMKSDATYTASLAANDIALTSIAVIATPGAFDAVSDRIRANGGAVTFADRQTGFISAVVHRATLGQLQQDSQIDALAIDHVSAEPADQSSVPPAHSSAEARTKDRHSTSEMTRNLGWQRRVARDRVDFLRDLGATQFVREHPAWDGRGVTIAHVENAPDFLAPELELASTVDGKPAAKYREITSFVDLEPRLDGRAVPVGRDAWQWVGLSQPVRAINGLIDIAGCRFHAPSDDEFRVGTIAIPSEITSALGLVTASCLGSDRFGVLWSEKQRSAWIDTNQDLDFRDEHAVGDFAATGQFGILSASERFAERRHSVGFALHREGSVLTFTFGTSSHATGVAGYAAGSLGRSGQVQGVAPGANFVLIAHGNTTSTFARALIMAFVGPADIVLLEAQYPTLGSDTDRSEGTVLDLLIERLIDRYKKPCFITGGNEPGLGSVSDPTPANAMVVGAWQSRQATRMHLGFAITPERTLHWATSEGPTGRGSLKPDFLAPVLHYAASTVFEHDSGHGIEDIPAGYQVFLGTSGATPVAAGAAALLISAAKQSGMRIEHSEIARALQSSARFIRGVAAVQQGTGTIDVGEAWAHLVDNLSQPQVEFRVEAPVETATSNSLANPNVGAGLFVREGVSLGKPIERCIRVTRISGPRDWAPFSLSWIGSAERAFTTPASISLPLNETVCIPVRIAPLDFGVHSSILEVRPPGHPNSVARRIPVTVVVPYELDAGHRFRASGRLPLSRPGRAEIFFRVLPGMEALNVEIAGSGMPGSVASKGTLMEAFFRSPHGELISAPTLTPTAKKRTLSIYRPGPGVWAMCAINYSDQVLAGPSRPTQRTQEGMSFRVTATRVDTDLTSGAPRLNVKNVGARVLGAIRSSALGMQTITPGSLRRGEQEVIRTFVPGNLELFVLELSTATGGSGHLDLLVFNCVDGNCQLSGEIRGMQDAKRLVLRRPKSGQWKIVVDGTYATGLKTDFSFASVFISSSYGAVVTDDRVIGRDMGATWSVSFRPTLRTAMPADPRAVLPIYFDDLINGSLHDFKSPKVQFGDQEDHREPAPLGLRWVDMGDSARFPK